MPELSRFGGMIIYMLFMDTRQHNKPHVHVYYGEYEAAIGIDGELLQVRCPENNIRLLPDGWLSTKRKLIKPGILRSGVNISKK